MRRRLDAELVERGLFPSRAQAQQAISELRVLVGGAIADKAARLVLPSDPLMLTTRARFVGRGGEKLDAALDRFALDVTGAHALDVGASTGGFTDCLLQRGAATVVAVDVGFGQLHERLRSDARVEVWERTNIRHAAVTALADRRFSPVVADLSFISLTTVAPAVTDLAAAGAPLVVLVKPQFEAGRATVSRGRGVITDPGEWEGALRRVGDAFAAAGAVMMGLMPSPVTGSQGNVEFLAHLRRDVAPAESAPSCDGMVSTAVAEAIERFGAAERRR